MIKSGGRLHVFCGSKSVASAAILSLLFVFLVTISLTASVHRWGDTSTYYMQIQSIANDFDIQYEQKDLQKAFENRFDDLPAGLFLIKDEKGDYFYGKEFSYALFAAPFFKIFGDNGILLFNAIMFLLMIYMGYQYLKRQNNGMTALIFSICYFFASVAFIYIFWVHAEIYNMFLIMLGFFLWFKSTSSENTSKAIKSLKEDKSGLKTSQTPSNWLFISAAVFGLATFAKTPNAVLFLPLLGWELYNRRFRNLMVCMSFFVVSSIVFYGYFYLATGTLTPYGGNRIGYMYTCPFMEDYDLDKGTGYQAYTTSSNVFSKITTLNIISLLYNMFYYLFGRFTGFAWYYMPAIIALYLMFRGKTGGYRSWMKGIFNLGNVDIRRVLLLAAIILNALFYIINGLNSRLDYFGGGHAIGNRYFYIFPAFLFLVDKIKADKKLVAFFMIAILFIAPVNINPVGNSANPCTHTLKLPYSVLPVEYSLLNTLPFWGHSHKIEGFENQIYYRLDDNAKWRSNGFLVEKHSEMLIKSKSKISDYRILLSSSSNNNAICLDIGNIKECFVLDNQEIIFLTFQNVSSVYNEKYFVYRISVSSDGKTWFRPINLEEKNILCYIEDGQGIESWRNVSTSWTSNNATIFIEYSMSRTGWVTTEDIP